MEIYNIGVFRYTKIINIYKPILVPLMVKSKTKITQLGENNKKSMIIFVLKFPKVTETLIYFYLFLKKLILFFWCNSKTNT